MSTNETYNGWANWDTWNTALWLNNDEVTHKRARSIVRIYGYNERKCEYMMREVARYAIPRSEGIDFDQVDWDEVIADFKDDEPESEEAAS